MPTQEDAEINSIMGKMLSQSLPNPNTQEWQKLIEQVFKWGEASYIIMS